MSSLHLEGKLQRQAGMLKSWKKYHCELRDDLLTCRNESKGTKSSLKRDVIDLSEAHAVRRLNSTQKDSQLQFQIVTKAGKTFTFLAETHDQVTRWTCALQMAMRVRRRSLARTPSEDDRETHYSEPWDLKQPVLPLFFPGNKRDSQNSSQYATPDNYSPAGQYATPENYSTPDQYSEPKLTHSESDYASCTYFQNSSASHKTDATDGSSEYAEPEIRQAKFLQAPETDKADQCESPVLLRNSSRISRLSRMASRPDSATNTLVGSDSPPPTPTPKTLNEKEIENLLIELTNRKRETLVPLPGVKYSSAMNDLDRMITGWDDAYQLVNRRNGSKGTYVDKLRDLLMETEEKEQPASFEMEL